MLKIVIKMRSFKKLINQDLLQLALIISLLKVDPDSYLGLDHGFGYDSGGGVILGEPVSYPGPSPVYPLKDPTQLIQRYQEDIIHELNTLGSFNRFSLYNDVPVQLSAYLVDTDQPCMDSGHNTDSDSGISDTERDPGSPCSRASSVQSPPPSHQLPSPPPRQAEDEQEKAMQEDGNDEGMLDLALDLEEGLSAAVGAGLFVHEPVMGHDQEGLSVAAESVFGDEDMIVEYGPEIPQELVQAGIPDIEDHGAIQYELMHMEEQLANLDYNIEDLDEEFIKMDEEIALTFSQNDLDDQEEVDPFQDILAESSEAFTGADNILGAVAAAPNPFDAWEREASSAIPELLQLDNILAEPLYNSQDANDLDLNLGPLSNLGDLDTMQNLEEFNLDLLDDDVTTENEILRNDVMFSVSRDSGDLEAEPRSRQLQDTAQVYSPETFIPVKSQEEDEDEDDDVVFLDQTDYKAPAPESEKEKGSRREEEDLESKQEAVKAEEDGVKVEVIDQEDLMSQVMTASGILDGAEIKEEDDDDVVILHTENHNIKPEDLTVEDEEEEEVLQEELLDVVTAQQFELQMAGGACARVDLEAFYGRPGKGLLAMTQQSLFNWDAFSNDHGHYASAGATPKLEPETIKLEPLEADDEEEATVEGLAATSGRAAETGGGGRRRNVSESSFSSGYHSSEDTRSTRDEKLAAKMGLPYNVQELINCPVDRFNQILADPSLTKQQIKICKDIRRRGKNKVAAQNCRKRKQETIEDLQLQVEAVRRRRAALLREREQLEQERQRWSSKLLSMEQFVLRGLGKDIAEYTLKVMDDRVELTARVGGGEADRGSRGASGGRSRR